MPSYFRTMILVAAGLASLTAAFAIGVDPYRVWDTPSIPGLTSEKPRVYQRSVLAKMSLLERQKPKTLLLGNSRVEVGFDTESDAWPASAKPVFNAGLSGNDLRTAAAVLREAFITGSPRTVIVDVDFPDFLSRADAPSPAALNAAEERLPLLADGKPNPDYRLQQWKDRLGATLTIDALLDSATTLLEQRPSSVTMTRSGFNPHHEYDVFVARGGYHGLFAEKLNDYAREYSRYAMPDFSDARANPQFGYLAEIIRVTAAHDARLILFINPYHCEYLELLHKNGFWQGFEDWKRAVVQMIAQESERAHGSVHLVDFSGYNPISTEPVPRQGDTHTQMRWYWEAGHYKSALGELLVRRLMGEGTEAIQDVTTDNIESVLARIRESRNSMQCGSSLSAAR